MVGFSTEKVVEERKRGREIEVCVLRDTPVICRGDDVEESLDTAQA